MKAYQSILVLFISVIMIATAGCSDDNDDKNHAPEANAGQDQTVQLASDSNVIVQFNGGGSSDEDGDTLTYIWDFDNSNGDNDAESTDAKPTFKYYQVGTYIVTLTVNDGKLTDKDTVKITVDKVPGKVEAKITSDDDLNGIVHEGQKYMVNFSGASSTTLEGTITDYEWDFNYTGSFDVEGTDEEISSEFEPGRWLVALRVTNDTGAKHTDTAMIKVTYNMTYNETLEYDESKDYFFPINTEGAYYLSVIIVCDNEDNDGHDLDIYLYFPNGTEANNTDEEDTSHEEIRYDRNGEYRDRLNALGEWKVTIHNDDSNPFASAMQYDLYIEVVYFS